MQVPEWAAQRIRLEGGINELGKPNFRIVWGGSRMTVLGGKFSDFDDSGNKIREITEYRQMPKYPEAVNRFVVEQYAYPEMTRSDWEYHFTKLIDGIPIETMGPYPEQGDYECLKVLETPCNCKDKCENRNKHHRFVPLTATLLDAIIHVAKLNKHVPVKDRIEFARKRRERQAKADDDKMTEIIGKASRPSWALNPHVVLSHMKEGVFNG